MPLVFFPSSTARAFHRSSHTPYIFTISQSTRDKMRGGLFMTGIRVHPQTFKMSLRRVGFIQSPQARAAGRRTGPRSYVHMQNASRRTNTPKNHKERFFICFLLKWPVI